MRRQILAIVLIFMVMFGVTVCTLVVYETVDQSGFVIRYVWTERQSDVSDYLLKDSLVIRSHGSSWHDIMIQTVEPPNYHTNHSVVLSPELSAKVYWTLVSEGFLNLRAHYPDFDFPEESHSESAWLDVTIESPDGQKTVTFAKGTMIGILPKSYTVLANVRFALDQESNDLLDLSLEVSASLSSDPSIVKISGTFANHGDIAIEGRCGSSPFYVTVVSSDGQVVGEFPEFSMVDGMFLFPPHTETDLSDYLWNVSGLEPGYYVIEGSIAGGEGGVCSFTAIQITYNIR